MKIKLLISTLLCLLVFSKINAQTAVQWTNVLGQGGADNAYRSAVDKDGNIVVVGFFTDSVQSGAALLRSRGKQDIFIAKYRPTGSLVWAKTAADRSAPKAPTSNARFIKNPFKKTSELNSTG